MADLSRDGVRPMPIEIRCLRTSIKIQNGYFETKKEKCRVEENSRPTYDQPTRASLSLKRTYPNG